MWENLKFSSNKSLYNNSYWNFLVSLVVAAGRNNSEKYATERTFLTLQICIVRVCCCVCDSSSVPLVRSANVAVIISSLSRTATTTKVQLRRMNMKNTFFLSTWFTHFFVVWLKKFGNLIGWNIIFLFVVTIWNHDVVYVLLLLFMEEEKDINHSVHTVVTLHLCPSPLPTQRRVVVFSKLI